MWKYKSLLRGYCNPKQLRLLSSVPPNEGSKLPSSHTIQNETASLKVTAMHKPNKIDKWLLVWDKKYKTFEEVPNFVSCDKMEKARNWARIKISTYLMIGTVLGCIVMIYSGKQAAARGESVTKANLEMHRRYQEEMKAQANQPK
ncbi:UPF0389 protein CG9231 [Hetaerina americana]|uniref:UPF0389 protein CG9231 n=1 Tax=Hetaerina americana TaxID=62018 RepID=UPI003A7F34B1